MKNTGNSIIAKRMGFFVQFLKNPTIIGAVAPSSAQLTKVMLETVDFDTVNTIVEFGPGTGVFSEQIHKSIKDSTTYFAIEVNGKMVDHLKKTMPKLQIYHDSAVKTVEYLNAHSKMHADVIISGLPWAAFDKKLQYELLDATLEALEPGGQFITFAYLNGLVLPAGRKFYRKLKRSFSEVKRSRIVWKNFPPAFVYHCVK
jgi:phosphatidylethanolamine/phosphatidyl-N-methylethanolamine N-methyltransferase